MPSSKTDLILRARIWLEEKWPNHANLSSLGYAGIIGIVGALASVSFRHAITGLQWIFTHHTGSLVETAEALPWWERLLVPTVGGLFAGATIAWGRKLIKDPPS